MRDLTEIELTKLFAKYSLLYQELSKTSKALSEIVKVYNFEKNPSYFAANAKKLLFELDEKLRDIIDALVRVEGQIRSESNAPYFTR